MREGEGGGWVDPAEAPWARVGAGVLVSQLGQAADPERELARTVHLGSWETALAALADVSAPEPWALPGTATGTDGTADEADATGADAYGLLRAYLASTFRRVIDQDKITLAQDGTLAAFDCGLFAPRGERVLALLSATDGETPWRLEGFLAEGAGMLGAGVAERFATQPARATFADDARLAAFAPAGQVDADARRLSRQCVRDAAAERSEASLPALARDAEALAAAIERAARRARADVRLAAPAFDGASGMVHLLLPLCEEGSVRAEAALVLELDDEERANDVLAWPQARYRAVALAPLARARVCARVVSSELPRWLAPREVTVAATAAAAERD